MPNRCSKCGNELKFLENYGTDEVPLCGDCRDKAEKTDTKEEKNIIRLSSGSNIWWKRVFPILVSILLLIIIIICISSPISEVLQNGSIALLLLGCFIYSVSWKTVYWTMVDEVWEGSSLLLLKNGDDKDNVPFSEIEKINYSELNPRQKKSAHIW